MLLNELLIHKLLSDFDCPVTGLSLDSRAVQPGNVFFALPGTKTDGEIYIKSAIQNGAIAVLKDAELRSFEILEGKIPCLSLPNLSQEVGEIAARFYNYPSRKMRIIGVTGTNGKTSVTHVIAYLLDNYTRCGLIGTLGYGIYGALQAGSHTTPDAIHLQALLAQLQTEYAVMEVSSHALTQGRVNGINFEIAVLTNLSRDHLDYHQTMKAYAEAKRKLFKMPLKRAVINIDDTFGQSLLAPHAITYSLHNKNADVYANIRTYDKLGCQIDIFTPWGKGELYSPWFGEFNVSNVIAALTVLLSMGFSLSKLLSQLTHLPAVPGRMERFGQEHQATIIIDYAHTPDALEKTLLALRKHLKGNLWCVFGCGGDRDRGKRHLMGKVAQAFADKVILTDDNPRYESSQAIIDDILQGCPKPDSVIPDRKQAIHYALQNALIGDFILIAGKGHEDYQQIGDQRFPFSDRDLVA